jgi:hypothetical protein
MTTTATGATIVTIDVTANTVAAMEASTVLTFAFRISAPAARERVAEHHRSGGDAQRPVRALDLVEPLRW